MFSWSRLTTHLCIQEIFENYHFLVQNALAFLKVHLVERNGTKLGETFSLLMFNILDLGKQARKISSHIFLAKKMLAFLKVHFVGSDGRLIKKQEKFS